MRDDGGCAQGFMRTYFQPISACSTADIGAGERVVPLAPHPQVCGIRVCPSQKGLCRDRSVCGCNAMHHARSDHMPQCFGEAVRCQRVTVFRAGGARCAGSRRHCSARIQNHDPARTRRRHRAAATTRASVRHLSVRRARCVLDSRLQGACSSTSAARPDTRGARRC
eukprot:3423446-Rhodomonas_salina.1